MMRMMPWRRTTRHFSHRRFTDAATFIVYPLSLASRRSASRHIDAPIAHAAGHAPKWLLYEKRESFRQDLASRFCHDDGVLEMGGERTVGRHDRPTIS